MTQLASSGALLVGALLLSACSARIATSSGIEPVCPAALAGELPPRPTAEQMQAARDSARVLGEDPSAVSVALRYERKPTVINRRKATAVLQRHYPRALLEAGHGGTARVWTLVDAAGRVQATELSRSSGRSELDRAAVAALREFDFAPAVLAGCRTAAWIELPVSFAVNGA